jgi:acyl-CoA thioesterase
VASTDDNVADALARACADVLWAGDRASRELGLELEEVRAGYARARMRVSESMVNGHDICHGGYVFLLADTAFAFACNSHDESTVAAACDIVFVTPARRGDDLVAEAHERLRFGRNGLVDVTVTREEDGAVIGEFRGRSRATGERIVEQRES